MSDPDTSASSTNSNEPRLGRTVAALATPPGRGAIATVLVRGIDASRVVGNLCGCDVNQRIRNGVASNLHIGRWNGPAGERVVMYVHSNDRVEIHCHGGVVSSRAILADLAAVGIHTVSWRDLCRRAERPTIENEALEALTEAPTLRTASILLDQYNGALTRLLRHVLTMLNAGNVEQASADLRQLLANAELGSHLVSPWRVAIVGPPNVGKSSLLNAILGYNRAIVHATPGTTRDPVSATTAIDGWPIEFLDTAGIRAAHDELESAGIGRSLSAMAQSQCQLFVSDVTQSVTTDDDAILRSCTHPIFVANKGDLLACRPENHPKHGIVTSARTGIGLGELLSKISRSLVPQALESNQAILFTTRQHNIVRGAIACLEAKDIVEAVSLIQVCVG